MPKRKPSSSQPNQRKKPRPKFSRLPRNARKAWADGIEKLAEAFKPK